MNISCFYFIYLHYQISINQTIFQMQNTTPTTFWKLWTEELKVSFPKKQLTNALQKRWDLTHPNVIGRLKKEKFPNLTKDIPFLYECYGIGYTIEKGFFFDEEKFKKIQDDRLNSVAKSLGLSK